MVAECRASQGLHEAVLEGNPLQLEGWSEQTIVNGELLRVQHDGLSLCRHTQVM